MAMAEEYYYKTYPVTLNIGEEERKKKVMDIFLAGLKANWPKWHDLREDPNDLPKDDMYEANIITPSGDWEKGIFRRIDGECYWRIIGFNENIKAIAWCEAPVFDKK